MHERAVVVKYLLNNVLAGDIDEMSDISGYSKSTINAWCSGNVVPNHKTIEYLSICIFTPEFKVVEEFYEIDSNEPTLTQLKKLYGGHENRSGIYAFYDSMANLLYVGKAKNLLKETYDAIRRDYEIIFPAGTNNTNIPRHQVVKYISAYDVKTFEFFDYPKHVESLILRISKPIMNKQIGILEEAYPKIEE